MSALTATAQRPDAREVGLAVINRVLPKHRKGIHAASNEMLRHEAERLEGQPPSPINTILLSHVDAERLWRRHLWRMGVGR